MQNGSETNKGNKENECKLQRKKSKMNKIKFILLILNLGSRKIKRKLWQMIFNNPVVEKSKNKLKEKISQIVAHFPLLRILSKKELK